MQLKKVFMYVFAACMVASCTNDLDFEEVRPEQDGDLEFTVEIEPYVNDSGARTRGYFVELDDLDNEDDFEFKFEKNDKFGICSVDGEVNLPLLVKANKKFSAGTEVKLSMDDEVKGKLIEGRKYVLYYPYNEDRYNGVYYYVSDKELGLRFDYSGQKQKGDDKYDIIGKERNYYVSEIFEYNGGNNPFKNVKLKPLGAVIHLQVYLPKIDSYRNPGGKYVCVGLENVDGSSGFYSFVSAESKGNGDFNFSYKAESSSLVLNLEDVYVENSDETGFGTCDFYMVAYPGSTGNFKVKVTNFHGITYYSHDTKNLDIKAGKYYSLEGIELDYPTEAGHEYVDLGLPSGLLWATANVGTSNPYVPGYNLAWGEIEYKKTYNWNNYKFGTKERLKEYDQPYMTFDPCDDAAFKIWGGKWQTPSHEDFEELENNCFWLWTNSYMGTGVKGYIVYKARKSQEGNVLPKDRMRANESYWRYTIDMPHIFLPCCGYMKGTSLYGGNNNYYGMSYYMTSNLDSEKSECNVFEFNDCGLNHYGHIDRCYGLCVRPVFKK